MNKDEIIRFALEQNINRYASGVQGFPILNDDGSTVTRNELDKREKQLMEESCDLLDKMDEKTDARERKLTANVMRLFNKNIDKEIEDGNVCCPDTLLNKILPNPSD